MKSGSLVHTVALRSDVAQGRRDVETGGGIKGGIN